MGSSKDARSVMLDWWSLQLSCVICLLAICEVLGGSCPSQPWNLNCPVCCETSWLACRCQATGLVTGYDVPCCRNESTCRPCVAYPGCGVFDNCKECVVRLPGGYRYPDNHQRFCTRCNVGWKGSMCKECGGLFKSNRGMIEMQGYPNDVNCTWTIDVSRNSAVHLRFERFDVESDPHCSYDALKIFDGGAVERALAVTLCGPTTPPSFTSRHHHVVLKFKSDESGTFEGFRIRFRKMDVCTRQPCLNHGECIVTGPTTFRCECSVGFFGIHCELPVRCSQPTLTPHLNYAFKDKLLRYGSKITYRCGYDRRLVGPRIALCTKNGRWSSRAPVCVEGCPSPRPPAHGQVGGANFRWGSEIIYTCKPGFHLHGNIRRVCRRNSRWSGKKPVCVFTNTSSDEAAEGGEFETSASFQPINVTEESTHFKNISCSEPISPTGGFIVTSSTARTELYHPGFSITYRCNTGDVMMGKTNAFCKRNGTWSNTPPKCFRTCPNPGTVSHGYTTIWRPPHARSKENIHLLQVLVVGSILKVRCAPEMSLNGVFRRVCLPTGRLSGERQPTCKPRCGFYPITPLPHDLLASPWNFIIKKRNRVSGVWRVHCNGDNLILTSARCVTYPSTNLVYRTSDLEVQILSTQNGLNSNNSYTISTIIIHEDFDPVLHHNDIAIFAISEKIPIHRDRRVWPICLTTRPNEEQAGGFYVTSATTPTSPAFHSPINSTFSSSHNHSINTEPIHNEFGGIVFKTVVVRKQPNKKCRVHGPNSKTRFCIQGRTKYNGNDYPSKLLIVKKRLAQLNDTSGGWTEKIRWVLIGISSFRGICNTSTHCYESFVKVRPYLTWISKRRNEIKTNGFLLIQT